jgi:hypothetical protein
LVGIWRVQFLRSLEVRRWTMDDGRWTMDDGRWTMDDGRWSETAIQTDGLRVSHFVEIFFSFSVEFSGLLTSRNFRVMINRFQSDQKVARLIIISN